MEGKGREKSGSVKRQQVADEALRMSSGSVRVAPVPRAPAVNLKPSARLSTSVTKTDARPIIHLPWRKGKARCAVPEFRVEMRRAPGISEAERRRRLHRAYEILLEAARKARARNTDAHEDTGPTPRKNAAQSGEGA